MRRRMSAMLFAVLMTGSAWADSANSLQDCFQAALKHNPDIQAQIQRVKQLEEQQNQLVGTTLPQVKALATQTYQDTSGVQNSGGVGSAFTAGEIPNYRVNVTQGIFHGLKEWSALDAAKAQVRREQLVLTDKKRQLFRNVADLYFQALILEKDAKNVREIAAVTDKRIVELKRFAALGKVRQSDVWSAESQSAGLLAEATQLDGQVQVARLRLIQAMGAPLAQTALADSPVTSPLPLASEISAERVSKRSEIQALKADAAAYQAIADTAWRTMLPTVDLSGNYYLKRTPFLDPVKWDAAVNVAFPLYQGGTDWAVARQAEARQREAEATLTAQVNRILADIQADYALSDATSMAAKQLGVAYEKSQASYTAFEHDYRLGLATNLEVIQALNALLTSKRNLDKATLQIVMYGHFILADLEETL